MHIWQGCSTGFLLLSISFYPFFLAIEQLLNIPSYRCVTKISCTCKCSYVYFVTLAIFFSGSLPHQFSWFLYSPVCLFSNCLGSYPFLFGRLPYWPTPLLSCCFNSYHHLFSWYLPVSPAPYLTSVPNSHLQVTINSVDHDLRVPSGEVIRGAGLADCDGTACGRQVCLHGGTCTPAGDTFVCTCPQVHLPSIHLQTCYLNE